MVPPSPDPSSAAAIAQLVASHREFLAFLERRLGDRTAAEDLLQDAFVKGVEKVTELRAGDSARAWFYRLLRNALVDRHRRTTVAERRLRELADELAAAEADRRSEADRAVCACIARLVDTLPPAEAQALRRIELDGVAVKDFAVEAGIGESNAGVRVFRARKALRNRVQQACGTCAEHGCTDCTCRHHGG